MRRWSCFAVCLWLTLYPAIGGREKPEIVGQKPLQVTKGKSLTLQLTDLEVNDPGKKYPSGFQLEIFKGKEYTVRGTTIIPHGSFTGTLTVPVRVASSKNNRSNKFDLKINVIAPNVKPKIIGQVPLSMEAGTSLEIKHDHLVVSDPDNDYPSGFTIAVRQGANYTVMGTTITPDASFSGSLTVRVSVHDGQAESEPFPLVITVKPPSAVNQKPVITGQSSLTLKKNGKLTLALSHLQVADADDPYPQRFTLKILPGDDYTVEGHTITPKKDFTGNLKVPVKVNDGKEDSDPYTLIIAVLDTDANVLPKITGQEKLSVKKNESVIITLAHLKVTDPDNTYPDDFTLTVQAGTNYSVNDNTVTPAPDFSGTLTVSVVVNDGSGDSEPFLFKLEVLDSKALNVKPVITGQHPLTVQQNESLLISLADLTVTDPDNVYPDDFRLTLFAGEHYAVANTVITPVKNFTGKLSVKAVVNDGTQDSDPFELMITVQPVAVNTPPVITKQSGLSTTEGQPIEIKLTQLSVYDPDNTYPDDFTLEVMAGENYTVTGNVVHPTSGFTGSLRVLVRVHDRQDASQPFMLAIKVVPREELIITAQTPLMIMEDTPLTLKLDHFTLNIHDKQYPTGYELMVMEGENYTVSGTTVEPVNDFFGELIVPVVIRGNGQQTQPFDVLVIVKPVNDAPELHHLETNAIEFAEGEEPVPVTTNAVVYDADDEFLMGATIMVSEGYQEGADQLYFRNTDVIRGVFDTRTGTLSLTGQASLNEYQEAIRSVLYVYSLSSDTLTFIADKKLSVQLNDGKVLSERYERTVAIREQLGIDIPNAFTPNNDLSNDTWRVKPVQNSRIYHNALIRVYTKRGELVFQSRGFELEWDGKSNGVRLPADTYYYIIQTERKEYKGAVLILHE